jgi:hypothetical protein
MQSTNMMLLIMVACESSVYSYNFIFRSEFCKKQNLQILHSEVYFQMPTRTKL